MKSTFPTELKMVVLSDHESTDQRSRAFLPDKIRLSFENSGEENGLLRRRDWRTIHFTDLIGAIASARI